MIEKVAHYLKHQSEKFHLYEKLYQHVVQELMNLGIIGFVLTMIEIFVDLDINSLHVVEIAHFVLLFFGLFYVFHSYLMYKICKRIPKKIEEIHAERIQLVNKYRDPMRRKRKSKKPKDVWRKVFDALSGAGKEMFYIEKHLITRRPNLLNRKFNFVAYMRKALEHELIHIIHIKNTTWGLAILLCGVLIAIDQIWLTTCPKYTCKRREEVLWAFVTISNIVVCVANPLLIHEANRVFSSVVADQKTSEPRSATAGTSATRQSRTSSNSQLKPTQTFSLKDWYGQTAGLIKRSKADSKKGDRDIEMRDLSHDEPLTESKPDAVEATVVVALNEAETKAIEEKDLGRWKFHHEFVARCVEVQLFFQSFYIGMIIMVFGREAKVAYGGYGAFVIVLQLLPCVFFLVYFVPKILERYFIAHCVTAPDRFIDSVLSETIANINMDSQVVAGVRGALKEVFRAEKSSKLSQAVYQAFHNIDQDGDGAITPGELRSWMMSKGLYEEISERRFRRLWRMLDEGKNGLIDTDDFVRVILLDGSHSKTRAFIQEMKRGKHTGSSIFVRALVGSDTKANEIPGENKPFTAGKVGFGRTSIFTAKSGGPSNPKLRLRLGSESKKQSVESPKLQSRPAPRREEEQDSTTHALRKQEPESGNADDNVSAEAGEQAQLVTGARESNGPEVSCLGDSDTELKSSDDEERGKIADDGGRTRTSEGKSTSKSPSSISGVRVQFSSPQSMAGLGDESDEFESKAALAAVQEASPNGIKDGAKQI